MARYIDADKVINNLPDDLPYKASVKRVLTQAQAEDVVEVVRCNDCMHNAGGWCILHDACFDKDFYCCFGFKRKGETS